MSTIVRRYTTMDIDSGIGTTRNISCCDDAADRIKAAFRLLKAIKENVRALETPAQGIIIENCARHDIPDLNYCPVCGDRIKITKREE